MPTTSAVKLVGPLIETAPAVPDGVITSEGAGPPLVDPHPQSDAPTSQAVATNHRRMKLPRLRKSKIPGLTRMNACRREDPNPLPKERGAVLVDERRTRRDL